MLDQALKAVLLVILVAITVWLVSCTVDALEFQRDPAGYIDREVEKLFGPAQQEGR
jgi:TM2 domain-containing membrane protein YozV